MSDLESAIRAIVAEVAKVTEELRAEIAALRQAQVGPLVVETGEAARILGVSPSTLRRLPVRCVRGSRGQRLYPVAALREWVDTASAD